MSINTCPGVNDFRFKGRCSIESCLNFSTKCGSNCMVLGITAHSSTAHGLKSRHFSTSEITHYKSHLLGEMSNFAIGNIKKTATSKIRNIIALSLYIDYINQNVDINKTPNKITPFIEEVFKAHPFNIKTLNLRVEMLPCLLDKDVFKSFIRRHSHLESEQALDLSEMLELDQKDLTKLKKQIKACFL